MMIKNCSQFLFVALVCAFYVSGTNAQVPNAPENLQVRDGLFGTAILRWDSVVNADGYRVYKSVDGADFHKIADLRIREFWDWALYPHHHYTYRVTALNQFGEGAPSNAVNFDFDGQSHTNSRAVIKGKVIDDSTGLPLSDALISVFTRGGLWVTHVRTDTVGNYRAAVDTGRFIVRADKFEYVPEWYDNVRNVGDAFVVELHQDSLQ